VPFVDAENKPLANNLSAWLSLTVSKFFQQAKTKTIYEET